MNPGDQAGEPAAAPAPTYLPWYFHVGLMVFLLVTAFFILALEGGAIFLIVCAATGPAIMFAVAGKGNRLLYLAIVLVLNALLYPAVSWVVKTDLTKLGLIPGLLWCISTSLCSPLFLWIAHSLNRHRRARAAAHTKATIPDIEA